MLVSHESIAHACLFLISTVGRMRGTTSNTTEISRLHFAKLKPYLELWHGRLSCSLETHADTEEFLPQLSLGFMAEKEEEKEGKNAILFNLRRIPESGAPG